MQPADDYVADFVAGISRLKVVKAHAVMQPLAMHESVHGPLGQNLRTVSEDENLSALINMAIDDDAPIIVARDSERLGVIGRADILKTVIEGADV